MPGHGPSVHSCIVDGFPSALQDRFRPLRHLGAGAMGTVFLAEDLQLAREVAIKLVHDASNPELRDRFLREIESLARVRHPNVMQVYDWGLAEGSPYLVIEYLDGQSLESASRCDLLSLARQLADALDEVHRRGLVHRDLKPANVMLCRDGRAVLTDFGLVRNLDRTQMTATGNVVGSLGYLGPEVLRCGTATAATDWYALGATLYVLAEGQLPYTTSQVMEAAQGAHYPPPHLQRTPSISPLGRAVMALLEDDPERRPRSRAALEALLTGDQTAAGSPPQTPMSRPGGRPWVLVALLLSLALAGAWLGPRSLGPPHPAATPSQATAPAPTAPPFDADYPRRVREELSNVAELMVRPDGEVSEPPDGTPPAGWHGLLDGDPVRFARALPHLPELARFHAFLAQGGAAEDLPRLLREGLEVTDSWYQRRGLLPPFGPYLTPAPGGPALPHPLLRTDGMPADIRSPTGWLGELARSHRLASAFMDACLEELPSLASRLADSEPDAAAILTVSSLRGVPSSLSSLIRDLYRGASTRRFVATWLRPGQTHLLRLLHAAGRTTREGGLRAEVAGLAGWIAPHALKPLYCGAPAYLPLASMLGPRPETAAGWALWTGTLVARMDIQDLVVGRPFAQESLEAFRDAWPRALEEVDEAVPTTVQRWSLVLSAALDDMRRHDLEDRLAATVATHAPRLRRLGASAGAAWLQLLQAWAEDDLVLGHEDLVRMREAIEASRPLWPASLTAPGPNPLRRLEQALAGGAEGPAAAPPR